MNDEHNHSHDENCDCGHHDQEKENDKYQLKVCPTERWADGLIDYLKKEFEKESEENP